MIEAYDFWLVCGVAGILLTIASLIGSALMSEIPYKAMGLATVTGICLVRAFQIAEQPLTWNDPIEATVRVYGYIF